MKNNKWKLLPGMVLCVCMMMTQLVYAAAPVAVTAAPLTGDNGTKTLVICMAVAAVVLVGSMILKKNGKK